jgi:hypothetical protein
MNRNTNTHPILLPQSLSSTNYHSRLYSKKDDNDMDKTIQAFLDRPFYDPDAVLDSLDSADDDNVRNSLQYRFASFVKNDYETAESLLVGGYMFALVLVTQQIVRLIHHSS